MSAPLPRSRSTRKGNGKHEIDYKQTGLRTINHEVDTNYAWIIVLIIVLFCLDLFCHWAVGKMNNPSSSLCGKNLFNENWHNGPEVYCVGLRCLHRNLIGPEDYWRHTFSAWVFNIEAHLYERSQSYRLSDLSKSRCSWPVRVKFYIFQFKRSSTQRLVEEWTKCNQASSVNRDNIYIRMNFKKDRANHSEFIESVSFQLILLDLVVYVYNVIFVLSNKHRINSGNWKQFCYLFQPLINCKWVKDSQYSDSYISSKSHTQQTFTLH